jgi:adenosylcobinamide amidohydrolase
MIQTLTNQVRYEQTDNHIHVEFSSPHRVISSAVLNGGLIEASHILNLKVPKHSEAPEAPITTLTKYCTNAGWDGTAVAMMTAASMGSFRLMQESVQGITVAILVTSGLSNPRRTGDRAEYRQMISQPEEAGTINIIAMTSAHLTDAAMVEALLMVTEAKTAALQDIGILSPVSHRIATGTGTDSVAVVSGHGPESVAYCGKHVLFGEVLGRLTTEAVAASIEWYREHITEVLVAKTIERQTVA